MTTGVVLTSSNVTAGTGVTITDNGVNGITINTSGNTNSFGIERESKWTGTSTPSSEGISVTTFGVSFVDATFNTTSFRTSAKRASLTATAANQVSGTQVAPGSSGGSRFYRSTVTGSGGFEVTIRWSIESHQSNADYACGVCGGNPATYVSGDPSTFFQDAIMWYSSSGNANWSLFHRTASSGATVIPLGIARGSDQMWEMTLTSLPGSSSVSVLIDYWPAASFNKTTVYSANLSSNLPTINTVLQYFMMQRSNTTGLPSIGWSFLKIKTDY